MGKNKNRIENMKMYRTKTGKPISKNKVIFNTHNSPEHEAEKSRLAYEIQMKEQWFATEVVDIPTGDIIDLVNLDEPYPQGQIEIVKSHGEKKAVSNGRRVVKVE